MGVQATQRRPAASQAIWVGLPSIGLSAQTEISSVGSRSKVGSGRGVGGAACCFRRTAAALDGGGLEIRFASSADVLAAAETGVADSATAFPGLENDFAGSAESFLRAAG